MTKTRNTPLKVACIVGARPNFIKAVPLLKALREKPEVFEVELIHTGQHYSYKMSKIFFDELGISAPEINFNSGSGTHAEQTARIIIEFEKYCMQKLPGLAIVFGDINSTSAVALTAKKLNIPLAHVEAGLRSFDRRMPEEINRIVTDSISDILFVTEKSGCDNLLREGHSEDSIHLVGNCMIDTLESKLEEIKQRKPVVNLDKYALLTLHRPSNTDDPETLTGLLEIFDKVAKMIPLVFPAHPRTVKQINALKLTERFSISSGTFSQGCINLIEPVGYLDFQRMILDSEFVMSDSGGIQEETTYLRVPCLTLRENTERPVTCEIGSNTLVGNDKETLLKNINLILNGKYKAGNIPEKWDGMAAKRIVEILETIYYSDIKKS